MAGVRRAGQGDAAVIVEVLASAFSEDPLFRWMTRRSEDLETRTRPFFANVVGTQLRQDDHQVYVHDSGDAAAIWYGVDRWKVPPGQIVRGIPATVRTFGLFNPRPLRVLGIMEKAHPTEPHYYLEFLGTRRGAQGQGRGSAVLMPVLERCDAEGLPAYLENSNPRNTAFYARHGFVAREPLILPSGAPELLPMWREPRG